MMINASEYIQYITTLHVYPSLLASFELFVFSDDYIPVCFGKSRHFNRARQLYKNISMLFLFPVKDGKLTTAGIMQH